MFGGGIVGTIGGLIGGILVWIISGLGIFYYDPPVDFFDVLIFAGASGFIGGFCGIGTASYDTTNFKSMSALVLGMFIGGAFGYSMGETILSSVVHTIILAPCFGLSGYVGIKLFE